jgi:hypothetical protein
MNKGKKSRKLLLIATALTIVALVSVMYTYAAFLVGTFQGGEVTVGGVGSSTIMYSTTNSADPSTWSTTLQVTSLSTPWYASLEIGTSNKYSGPVTITWQLENETAPNTWSPVSSPVTTNVTLSKGAQTVYASENGTITDNTNWESLISLAGTYNVTATIDSV